MARKRSSLLDDFRPRGRQTDDDADGDFNGHDAPDDDETDESETNEPGGEYRAFGQLRQPKASAFMLTLQRKSGEAAAFPYGWLARATYDPAGGIELDFAGAKVSVKGRNLNSLFVGITRHLVFRATEADPATAVALPPEATVIEQLNVKDQEK